MFGKSSRVKKTRAGNVFKEVKDRYLRKEIPCGVLGCAACKNYPNNEILDPNNNGSSCIFPTSHFLIPESSVLIKQIDLFENDQINNIIILQTILNQIRQLDAGVYKRLQAALNISEKCIYVFNNEYHEDTFVSQGRDESSNEWETRLYEKACDYYAQHLNEYSKSAIIVAIYDKDAPKCRREVRSSTFPDYILSLLSSEELVDSLVIDNFSSVQSLVSLESKTSFPEHLSPQIVNVGIKSGKYLSGIFYQNPDDHMLATVKVRNSDSIFTIVGIFSINRAVTDDLVAIELVTEIEDIPTELRSDDGTNFEIPSTRKLVHVDPSKKFCRVVSVIKRNWKQYCGIVFSKVSADNFYLFQSMDLRIPFIMFESKRIELLQNKKICVSVDSWAPNFRYPRGHIVKILGDIGDKNVESESILMEKRIPFQQFSKSVLDCLPNLKKYPQSSKPNWNVDMILKDEPARIDLRHLHVCSIDPPGCTDIDDAVHCRLIETNLGFEVYEIGVHIADVTHYVISGTPLDREAYRRGTTVYLVDRRIDMLPELLSSNLCSLRPNEDRLAFSVLCYLDGEGNFVESCPVIYTKSVIRSKKAFTYNEAQSLMDDESDISETSTMLRKLSSIVKYLRLRRLERGALKLEFTEVRFEMDSETQEPLELNSKETMETNKLIEDCMLLANVLVATKIFKSYSNLALLRRHPPPIKEQLDQLYDVVNKRLGLSDTIDTCNLSSYLEKATLASDPFVNKIIKIISIRCLQQASYICSGCHNFESYFHYGLAEPLYTHFTSPIRRYPDIIVHRLLAAAIKSSNSDIVSIYDSNTIQQMCDFLNRRHTSAQLASRESIKLHLYLFLKNQPNSIKVEQGYITKLYENAVSVYVPVFHYQGFIRFDHKYCESQGIEINIKSGYIHSEILGLKICVFDRVSIQFHVNPVVFGNEGIKLSIVNPIVLGIFH
ncbi:hypothetical protein MXB_495 [Myxobolus squamalis]|nr:hypothetical protein MXB_495 [Myxobolus squamalis]